MILFDGKYHADRIAEELKEVIKKKKLHLKLAACEVGDDPVMSVFLQQKQKFAGKIGVGFEVHSFPETISEDVLKEAIKKIARQSRISGIIIQLPLPEHLLPEEVFCLLPREKDVDVLSPEAFDRFARSSFDILPPVVGALSEILSSQGIMVKGERVALVGKGRLVGRPLSVWLRAQGAHVIELDAFSPNFRQHLSEADMVISGTGEPMFLKGDMIKRGAMVIDAGTSEAGGKIVGDVDRESMNGKPSLLTPVPGGLGPLTVAMVFKNLVLLHS